MTEFLAVFRSRSQAIDCNTRLRAAGVPATLINTPKEANVGCGLSVKVSENALPRARFIIANSGYSAFYGWFSIRIVYGRTVFNMIK